MSYTQTPEQVEAAFQAWWVNRPAYLRDDHKSAAGEGFLEGFFFGQRAAREKAIELKGDIRRFIRGE